MQKEKNGWWEPTGREGKREGPYNNPGKRQWLRNAARSLPFVLRLILDG